MLKKKWSNDARKMVEGYNFNVAPKGASGDEIVFWNYAMRHG